MKEENQEFLSTQIITYIGNKRLLLKDIEREIEFVKSTLGKRKIVCADLFSGSGIVARMLKRHSAKLIVNDLEEYSRVINECYLTNKKDFPAAQYGECKKIIEAKCASKKIEGIIAKNYAPQNDERIQKNERVFYTRQNAILLDTYRALIDEVVVDEKMKKFFLAPLITEASIHVNTSGVFKGFYKDKNTGIGCFGAAQKQALSRILGTIELREPIFSDFNCKVQVCKKNAIDLAQDLRNIDALYLDPPYNQHPYGSNYFMLNLILKNRLDVEVSRVSGITQDWNRSLFNKARFALDSLEQIISAARAKFIIISYNSEGFIGFGEMQSMLKKYGKIKAVQIPYNTFRGSRNLKNRPIHVHEYLFVLEKSSASNCC